ncbi:hypothetical protein [Pseudomonas putida]|uniref:Uncharacterized protein n=1 Tax=Pseudomonas putida TaxID=303 RepID=A0A8I1EB81_PSEPU|nr:hypothetical protein [Pseudomonas putida]MBI6882451.1 hypothetical protein [Pseudomonas putida]
MSYSDFKNSSTREVIMHIDNTKDAQDKIIKGLVVCAKRYLGYSPKADSSPFITSDVRPKDQNPGTIVIPRKGDEGKKVDNTHQSSSVFGIRINSGFQSLLDRSFAKDEFFNPKDVDNQDVLAHVLDKYWAKALEMAAPKRKVSHDTDGLAL